MTNQQRQPFIFMLGLVSLVLLFLWAVTAKAQNNVVVTADKETVTVGDPIVLTVAVTHAEEEVVLFPELGPNWGDFVVRRQASAETIRYGDGTAVSRQQIDVRLFVPGAFQTPPLALTITDATGNVSESWAEPIPLSVQSVLVEGDTTLRDIKPQAALPLPIRRRQ